MIQKKLIIRSLSIATVAILLILSCKSSNKIPAGPPINEAKSPQIIFLNFKIVNDTVLQQYSIQLVNKIIAEGKLKENAVERHKPFLDDLTFVILDQNSKELEREYLPNPLNSTIEYVTEEGMLAKKNVKLESSQFSLRLQLVASAKYIEVKKYSGSKSDNSSLLKIDISK